MDKERVSPLERSRRFANWLGIRLPIVMAPMSGASPPPLAIAIANAGGLGGCGALLMQPDEIKSWSEEFRKGSAGEFQINLWIPDPPPKRDAELEKRARDFLEQWGPPVSPEAGDVRLPDFQGQCDAIVAVAPKVTSSIMGLYAPAFVAELKKRGIVWFAAVTTVAEAKAAERAGADVIVAQGMEAGGHRGAFQPDDAEQQMAGLMALVPQVVDAVSVPVIATGGIADARGIAAALVLGASAVQIGTGFLRCPEANIPRAYADQLSPPSRIRRWLHDRSAGARVAVLQTLMREQQAARMLLVQRRIRYSAGSLGACVKQRRRTEIPTACKCGQASRQNWRKTDLPAFYVANCGQRLCGCYRKRKTEHRRGSRDYVSARLAN